MFSMIARQQSDNGAGGSVDGELHKRQAVEGTAPGGRRIAHVNNNWHNYAAATVCAYNALSRGNMVVAAALANAHCV